MYNKNRVKGHNAERHYANVFKNLGFRFCTTARLGSRLYDNAKIDLINLPFNLQIKAGAQASLNPGRELFNMENMIKVLFPEEDPVHSRPKFLIHKKNVGRGNKPTDMHEIVYMSKKQYLQYKELVPSLSFVFTKSFKFEMNSEFKDITAITFEVFKTKILPLFKEQK